MAHNSNLENFFWRYILWVRGRDPLKFKMQNSEAYQLFHHILYDEIIPHIKPSVVLWSHEQIWIGDLSFFDFVEKMNLSVKVEESYPTLPVYLDEATMVLVHNKTFSEIYESYLYLFTNSFSDFLRDIEDRYFSKEELLVMKDQLLEEGILPGEYPGSWNYRKVYSKG